MEKITKHVEITVNLGDYQNIKIGTFLESGIEEGENIQTSNDRIFSQIQSMIASDIRQIFAEDNRLRIQALEMIGIFVDVETEPEPDYDLETPEWDNDHPF